MITGDNLKWDNDIHINETNTINAFFFAGFINLLDDIFSN